MATLFKKTYTATIPANAETYTRKGVEYARFKGRNGKTRIERLTDDGARLLLETESWYTRLRVADGGYLVINTKCKDRTTAEQYAANLQTEQDKVRAGVFTKKEANAAKHGRDALQTVIDAYLDSMTARGAAASTVKEWRRYLETVYTALGWQTLNDIDKTALDAYLEQERLNGGKEHKGRGARSCNAYVVTWTAFGNWLARNGKTAINPVAGLVRFDERADRRHIRRAFTLPELQALCDAAEQRPLQERQTNRGSKAELKPETVDALQWLGRTRALAYKALAYTGLRWNELRSITIGAAHLDAEPAFLLLEAANEKNRKGAQIPLQEDLRQALKAYRDERIKRLVGDCSAFPGAFDGVTLFDGLPGKMNKVFDADLAAARVKNNKGEYERIAKMDGAGRVLDVHALRVTFGTMLARAGVGLATAQRLMRHSTPALTANVYTILELTDTGAAVNALPSMQANTVEKESYNGE